MARTYYNYAERDPTKAIDWSSIAQDINTRLVEEAQRREDLKDELDEMTRQIQKDASEAPMSKSTVLNQWIVDGVSNITDMNYTLNRELKAGRLDPREFVRRTQRLSDGYQEIEGLAGNWGQIYDEKVERMLSGNSAHLERELMEFTEGLINFDNSGIFTTDDGRVLIGKKEVDASGNYTGSLDKGNIVDVNVLKALTDFKADRYDLDTDMTTMSDGFAKKWIRERGVVEMDDIRQNAEYTDAVDKLITSRLENSSTAAMDILMETGDYTTERDPSKAKGNPNAILLVPNENGIPMPQLTDAQMDVAKGIAKDVFETRLESSLTLYRPPVTQPTAAQVQAGLNKQQQQEDARNISLLIQRLKALGPDSQGFENAKTELRGLIQRSFSDGEQLLDLVIEKVPGGTSGAGRLIINWKSEKTVWDGQASQHKTVDTSPQSPLVFDLADDIANIATAVAPYVGLNVTYDDIRDQVTDLDDVDAYQFERKQVDAKIFSDLRSDIVATKGYGIGGAYGPFNKSSRVSGFAARLNTLFSQLASDGIYYAGTLKAEASGTTLTVIDTQSNNEVARFEEGRGKDRAKQFDELMKLIQSQGDFVFGVGAAGDAYFQ
jgi:hypothetical protein